MTMTLAVPSGKSLEENTILLLKEAKIVVKRRHSRACLADVTGFPGISRVVFAKPSVIPSLVADGDVAAGITGEDCVHEYGGGAEFKVFQKLEYSRATSGATRCVIFTKEDNPVQSIGQLGEGSTIVSEYPVETAAKLQAAVAKGARLTPCPGGAEALVVLGKYGYGVALVETGDTLRANGLRVIGTIFESSTILIGRPPGREQRQDELITFLGRQLRGVLDARGKTYLLMNAPADKVDAIKAILPSLKSPTVQTLADPAFVSIAAVVPNDQVNALKFRLARVGADGFVETTPSVIM